MDIFEILIIVLLLLTLFLIFLGMTIYFMNIKHQETVLRNKINDLEYMINNRTSNHYGISNKPQNTLYNEIRDATQYTTTNNETASPSIKHMPINIPTRGHPGNYTVVGVLNGIGNQKILPLYGRNVYNGSSKWNYYTSTDGYNTLNLSIVHKNKDCWSEYGCDELYSNDTVYVSGYDGEFKVNMYKRTGPTYIPYIV